MSEMLSFWSFLYKLVKLASPQLEEMHRERVVSFHLFTRERFTGDAHLKIPSRNGVLSLKCSMYTESGVTANGE